MKFVVDVNLSPAWCALLAQGAYEALHWSEIGAGSAKDREIIDWAAQNDRIVLTADLDFAAAVARSNLTAPAVVQLRTGNVDPAVVGPFVLEGIASAKDQLIGGTILTIDPGQVRLRRRPEQINVSDQS